MLRSALSRTAPAALSRRAPLAVPRLIRPALFIRYESTARGDTMPSSPERHMTDGSQPSMQTKSPEDLAREEAKKRRNEMEHDWDAKEISYEELKPRTESPEPETYLIDVREPDEVIQGMIPSAVNLPLSELANSLYLSPAAFLEKHGFEKPPKTQQLIFYCRSGKRSSSASDIAKRNGYTNILNYKGSWIEWLKKENSQKK